ncbi:MAG: methionyl-tRNA formyltransferase [Alphaproteobacteria bacterium]|nr:methionyl-tRNA formyltransferase [Alphaproteobacteria bacterium]
MRIVVNGQQAFGKAVLEALLERGEDVVAVYCAPDKEGRPVDPLKEAALQHDLPVFQPASFKDPAAVEEFRALKPDLGVMAYVILFVPEEFLNVPTHGTIQYHPSLLPKHRGPSSINWPIIQGSTKTGLTIFWPDNGLDTGPILLQKEVDIGPDDTLGSVYFDKLFPLGVEAMLESVDLVRDGKAPKVVQDEGQATYESWCKGEDVEIDWSRPAPEVYNMIRGANPQPGAWTRHAGAVLKIFESTRVEGEGKPGEVIAVDGDGFTVAAGGGAIQVHRVRPEGGKKDSAGAFAGEAGLKQGDVLG